VDCVHLCRGHELRGAAAGIIEFRVFGVDAADPRGQPIAFELVLWRRVRIEYSIRRRTGHVDDGDPSGE
jgi:hypothetical protein